MVGTSWQRESISRGRYFDARKYHQTVLIPLVEDIKADPFLAQLVIICSLPIIGLVSLFLPFILLCILYTLVRNYVKQSNTKRLRSSTSKFTNRRQTLRGDSYTQQHESQDREYGSGVDSKGRY